MKKVHIVRKTARATAPSKAGGVYATFARIETIPGGMLILAKKKAVKTKTVLISQPKAMSAKTAETVFKIVSTPISDEQRKRAAILAKKANAAQQTAVTARFRKVAAA